jgi:hypothetical protein
MPEPDVFLNVGLFSFAEIVLAADVRARTVAHPCAIQWNQRDHPASFLADGEVSTNRLKGL